jgi:hypothetical protein
LISSLRIFLLFVPRQSLPADRWAGAASPTAYLPRPWLGVEWPPPLIAGRLVAGVRLGADWVDRFAEVMLRFEVEGVRLAEGVRFGVVVRFAVDVGRFGVDGLRLLVDGVRLEFEGVRFVALEVLRFAGAGPTLRGP